LQEYDDDDPKQKDPKNKISEIWFKHRPSNCIAENTKISLAYWDVYREEYIF
jgi:hypothetical protein